MINDFVNGTPVPEGIRVEVDAFCYSCGCVHIVSVMIEKDKQAPVGLQFPCPICRRLENR
jgi:hypothetical protein